VTSPRESTFADGRYFLDLKGARKRDFVGINLPVNVGRCTGSPPGPVDGGSPPLAIQAAAPSNSEEEEEATAMVRELELILLLTDLLAIAFAS
jgi:hypothetical protein